MGEIELEVSHMNLLIPKLGEQHETFLGKNKHIIAISHVNWL